MKTFIKVLVMFVAVAFFSVSLSAKDTLIVLTDRSDFHLKNLTEQFAKERGIDVKVHYMKHLVVPFLKAHAADVDVVITKNSSTIILASKQGFLQQLPRELTRELKTQNVAKDNTWFNMSYRLRSFILKKGLKKYPITYEDLADPQYKGKICIRKFTHDYNIELFGAMLKMWGEEKFKQWLKGFKANLARKPQGNDRAQAKAVAEGKCEIGIMNTYYMGLMLQNSEQRAWASQLNLYIPNQFEEGAVALYSGVGMSKTAQHKELAVDFMAYLLNPIHQQYMSSINYEYPIIGVSGSKMVQSFGDFQGLKMEEIKIAPVDQEDIAAQRAKVLSIIKEIE